MKWFSQVLLAVAVIASFSPSPDLRSEPRPADQGIDFVAAPGSPVAVGPMAGRPAVGDCNGDGNPDIVIACGTC